ncbi:hypothetical protein P7K49_035272 [Saguinus oedipus]|uniref:Uncharacterized protein n=1 Tax=Saguinus oedipus TaxID=9490 RepID=A0ABQ9TM47_SAGOE|nr:hypothetical protein P7K49_035272 [Saguinus oedipus]
MGPACQDRGHRGQLFREPASPNPGGPRPTPRSVRLGAQYPSDGDKIKHKGRVQMRGRFTRPSRRCIKASEWGFPLAPDGPARGAYFQVAMTGLRPPNHRPGGNSYKISPAIVGLTRRDSGAQSRIQAPQRGRPAVSGAAAALGRGSGAFVPAVITKCHRDTPSRPPGSSWGRRNEGRRPGAGAGGDGGAACAPRVPAAEGLRPPSLGLARRSGHVGPVFAVTLPSLKERGKGLKIRQPLPCRPGERSWQE